MQVEKKLVLLIAELAEYIGSQKAYLKLEEQKPTDSSVESQLAQSDKIRNMKNAINSEEYALSKIISLFE